MSCNHERRHLLQGLALLLGMGMTIENAACNPKRATARSGRSRVARARRASVIEPATGKLDVGVLREMLEKAVAAALDANRPADAFRRLFRETDVVGIKINAMAGRGLSPNPELVHLLTEWLVEAKVRSNNIVIWDRTDRELESAGYRLNRQGTGVRCFGTNDDYDWIPHEWGAGGSCLARPLVSEFTALINVGVIKDHDLAGISAGMKNLYGVIHNPNKYHDNGCSPYVAHLSAYPPIRRKLRLTVLDGLMAQCHGGPARSPRWAWPWAGVLVSTDPVAIDALAHRIIEERRTELALKSLAAEGREPKWLAVAAELGLGEAVVDRIQVVDT